MFDVRERIWKSLRERERERERERVRVSKLALV